MTLQFHKNKIINVKKKLAAAAATIRKQSKQFKTKKEHEGKSYASTMSPKLHASLLLCLHLAPLALAFHSFFTRSIVSRDAGG